MTWELKKSVLARDIYHIFQTIRRTFPKNLGGKWGASYNPNVAYLARWGTVRGRRRGRGVTGGRSRVATAGSQGWQEWGDAADPGLGGGGAKQGRQEQSPHCGML